MIEKEDLKEGHLYRVSGLALDIGIWTGEKFRGPHIEYKVLKFREEDPYWVGLPKGICTPISEISEYKFNKPWDGINLLYALQIIRDNVLTIEEIY